MIDLHQQFQAAFRRDDATAIREMLNGHPELRAKINDPLGPFDSPLVTCVKSKEMLDAFLDAGADINARSQWWAGGFGLLDNAEPNLADYAIARGARLDAHSAARLGRLADLAKLVEADPALVFARGGDGQTPLHFASTVPVAEFLLGHGADIDALDIDHESTPAQYMVRDRQETARHLVARGCRADLLMAAALGDIPLAGRLLEANPDLIRARVNNRWFPMRNPRAGGTIYNWTLGWHLSAHDVAMKFHHPEALEFLLGRSPADVKLLVACWQGRDADVASLLAAYPDAAERLRRESAEDLPNAARNNDLPAVRLLLQIGIPIDSRGQHGGTALHWAAWHGNLEMTKLVLAGKPPLDLLDKDFSAPPLGWADHASVHGWRPDAGDYPGVTAALLAAGAKPLESAKAS